MKYILLVLAFISLTACGHKDPPLLASETTTKSVVSKPTQVKVNQVARKAATIAKPVGAAILIDWLVPDEVIGHIFLVVFVVMLIGASESIVGGLIVGSALLYFFW